MEKVFVTGDTGYSRINNSNYIKIFKNIAEEYSVKNSYEPECVIGCSFGVDLAVWRNILDCVFNYDNREEFDRYSSFNKALLITDAIYLKDSDVRSQGDEYIYSNNLLTRLYNGPYYLHSKLILIKYRNKDEIKYVLLIMSKNISDSTNWDYWVLLESKNDNNNGINGESITNEGPKLYQFIDYIVKNSGGEQSEEKDIIEQLEDLKQVFGFGLVNGDEGVKVSLKYNYDDNRIDDATVKEMLGSSIVISPFITEAYYKKWVEAHKDDNSYKLLSYGCELEKLDVAGKQVPQNEQWYMGFTNGNDGNYRFHSKIYADIMNKKTVVYTGSMNLTDNSFENNCEIMVRLEGPAEWFEELESEFFSIPPRGKIVECYNNKKISEKEKNDVSVFMEVESMRNDKYIVAYNEEKGLYRYYVVKQKKNQNPDCVPVDFLDGYGSLSSGTNKIYSYLPKNEEKILIIRANYASPEDLSGALKEKPEEGYEWLKYDEYIERYKSYRDGIISSFKMTHDNDVLLGLIKTNKDRENSPYAGNSKRTGEGAREGVNYPCLYRVIHDILRRILPSNPEISEETAGNKLLDSLRELKRSLCTTEYRDYVERLIVKFDDKLIKNTPIRFQDDTVKHIMDYYYPVRGGKHNAYLLADETGLGKTIIARRIIGEIYDKKWIGKKDPFKVLYVCSNVALGKKNLGKLAKGRNVNIPDIDRLSMFSRELIKSDVSNSSVENTGDDDNANTSDRIVMYSVTPALSFEDKGGTIGEYKFCFELYETYRKVIDNYNEKRKADNGIDGNHEIYFKIIMNSIGKENIGGYKDKVKDISVKIEKIYSILISQNSQVSRGFEKFGTDYKDLGIDWNVIEIGEDNWKEKLSKLLTEKIMKVISFWRTANNDYNKEYLEQIFCDEDNGFPDKKIPYFCAARKYKANGSGNELLVEVLNNIIGKYREQIPEQIQELNLLVDAIKNNNKSVDIINNKLYNLYNYTKKNIYKEFEAQLSKTITNILGNINNNNSSNNNDFENMIRQIVFSMADRQIFILQRKFASFLSLVLLKPDLVIIDEMQTYPQLFSGKKSGTESKEEDEQQSEEKDVSAETEEVRLIMDTILEDEEGERKVLMLSATPYAYRNVVVKKEEDNTLKSEEDKFLEHLVGIEEIITYLGEKNGIADAYSRWKDLYKKYSSMLRSCTDTPKDFDVEKYIQVTDELGCVLRDIGISRVERYKDNADMDMTSGLGYLDYDDITFSDLYYHDVNGINERKNMSVSHCIKGKMQSISCPGGFEFAENSRINKLMDVCVPEGINKLLFIPPTKPHYELSGVFRKYRNYTKTILFSAYNDVPTQLADIILDRVNDNKQPGNIKVSDEKECRTDNTGICDLIYNSAKEQYEKYVGAVNARMYDELIYEDDVTVDEKQYMGSIYAYFVDNYGSCSGEKDGRDNKERICKKIYKYFLSEHARVCLGVDDDIYYEEYVKKIHEYCYSGNIRAVLDEFIYILMSDEGIRIDEWKAGADKNLGKLEGYFSDCEKLVNIHSSAMDMLQKDGSFENVIDHFQSPFYPFVMAMTSVAQEGFDFHWYCNRIIHWNVPSTPIALIQREGRIDRYNCMGIRKNLCERTKDFTINSFGTIYMWDEMFKKVQEDKQGQQDLKEYKGMYPHWVLPVERTGRKSSALIERGAMYYMYSEEYFRWQKLVEELHYYKGLLGTMPINFGIDDAVMKKIKDIKINLYPELKKY